MKRIKQKYLNPFIYLFFCRVPCVSGNFNGHEQSAIYLTTTEIVHTLSK